ncbi:MAG: hypothetical protein ACQEQO_10890 [Thermodesulfobacteriota bacterium]
MFPIKFDLAGYLKLKVACEANRSRLGTAETSFNRLVKKIKQLRSLERNRWFLAGVLLLFSSLTIGTLMGLEQRRRQLSY